MKKIVFIIIALGGMMAGCGKQAIHHDTSEAERVAEECAKALLALDTVPKPDTIAMEGAVLEAKYRQSKFALANDNESVEAFDRVFKKIIEEKDPSLAAVLFTDPLAE